MKPPIFRGFRIFAKYFERSLRLQLRYRVCLFVGDFRYPKDALRYRVYDRPLPRLQKASKGFKKRTRAFAFSARPKGALVAFLPDVP